MKCINVTGNGPTIQWCCETAENKWGRGIGYNVFDMHFIMYKTCSAADHSLGVHETFEIFYCPFCRAECLPYLPEPEKLKRSL